MSYPMIAFLIAFPASSHQPPKPLEIGVPVAGVVVESDPVVETQRIQEHYAAAPVRGTTFTLRIEEAGTHHIDLHSYAFDAYLVIREVDAGSVIAEDDDGLLRSHARVTIHDLEPGRTYLVLACALHGGVGEFQIVAQRGESRALSAAERRAAALRDAREAVRFTEEKWGPAVPATANALLSLGSMLVDRGEYQEARAVLTRAVEIREKALGSEHADTAIALNALAAAFERQGAHREARRHLERAVTIMELTLGPEHPDTASTLNNLADLLQTLGSYEEARPLFERAIAIWTKVLGPEHPETAIGLNNLGRLLTARGSYSEARPLLERALAINEKTIGPNHPRTATALNNLAIVLQHQGSTAQARSLYERALAIRERVLGPEHPGTATALNNLARLLREQGSYAEARPILERALAIFEKSPGPDHPLTAAVLTNLAGLHQFLGSHERALPLFMRALSINERVLGPEHPDTARAIGNVAHLLWAHENYAAARPFFERVLAIREKTVGSNHPDTALTLNNLAALLQDQGDYAAAVPLYERALAIWENAGELSHRNRAILVNNLAGLLFDMGDIPGAFDLSRRAVDDDRAYLQRTLWSLTETERLRFAATLRGGFHTMLSIARVLPSEEARLHAFERLLRWKGQVSRSLLQSQRSLTRSMSPESQKLLERWRETQSELHRMLRAPVSAGREEYARRLTELEAERKKLDIELARSTGPLSEARTVGIVDLAKALPERAALVDFYVHAWYEAATRKDGKLVERAYWTEPHLSAWVLAKKGSLSVFDLGPAAPIQEAVTAYLRESVEADAEKRGVGGVTASRKNAGASRGDRVRELLWTPISKAVGNVRTVVVSPDSFLGTFPFEILPLEDGGFLIERHAFVYLQDMASLVTIAATEPRRDADASLLTVGGVDYSSAGKLAPRTPATKDRLVDGDLRSEFAALWRELPATVREAEAIVRIHAMAFENGERLLLKGEAACEERLKDELARHRFVHIASHGYFQPEGLPSMWDRVKEAGGARMDTNEPEQRLTGFLPGMLSGLVLSGANAAPAADRDDGFLTADELSWLDLSKVDLVVLSACETGLGSPRAGEGMLGLRRSLRQAGVKTVISTLWSVADESAHEMMSNFYERLWLRRETRIDALRHAQLDLLRKNRTEHREALPATWGAFVLDGEWR